MEIFGYSGPRLDLYGDEDWSDPIVPDDGPWRAPRASAPLAATVGIPGSKSITNRELVLASLADAPSVLRAPLHARDSHLMVQGLVALGTGVEEVDTGHRFGPDWRISPADELSGGVSIDCGLAGNVMRFLPVVAALGLGPVAFDGDAGARKRPMATLISALRALGVEVHDEGRGRLPFSLYGTGGIQGGALDIDASGSSQFVSGLLLSAARFDEGLTLHHTGDRLPSVPHIEMTLTALRARGVDARSVDERTWRVEPGPIAALDLTVEPDLSNAETFLLAPLLAGGEVRIPRWPEATTQVGDLLREILPQLGADVSLADDGDGTATLVCRVDAGVLHGGVIPPLDRDFAVEGGELVPNLAALAAFATGTSHLTGIGHLRGHETDRVSALASELTRVGAEVVEEPDALTIVGRGGEGLHGATWQCFADHRMATAGALVGLAVDGVDLDDVASTSKTLPQFVELWTQMLEGDPEDEGPEPIDLLSLGF